MVPVCHPPRSAGLPRAPGPPDTERTLRAWPTGSVTSTGPGPRCAAGPTVRRTGSGCTTRSPIDGAAFDGYAIDFGSYADRILGGSLRWSNDSWAATRSFFVDDHDPDWRDAIVGRR